MGRMRGRGSGVGWDGLAYRVLGMVVRWYYCTAMSVVSGEGLFPGSFWYITTEMWISLVR